MSGLLKEVMNTERSKVLPGNKSYPKSLEDLMNLLFSHWFQTHDCQLNLQTAFLVLSLPNELDQLQFECHPKK